MRDMIVTSPLLVPMATTTLLSAKRMLDVDAWRAANVSRTVGQCTAGNGDSVYILVTVPRCGDEPYVGIQVKVCAADMD